MVQERAETLVNYVVEENKHTSVAYFVQNVGGNCLVEEEEKIKENKCMGTTFFFESD